MLIRLIVFLLLQVANLNNSKVYKVGISFDREPMKYYYLTEKEYYDFLMFNPHPNSPLEIKYL